jgi:hypothetical protein
MVQCRDFGETKLSQVIGVLAESYNHSTRGGYPEKVLST